jgi:iron(III) transport system permease protein
VLLLPLVFLLVRGAGLGPRHHRQADRRPLTGQLLWNTVRLTVVVTALCAVIGTGAAWLIERTDLPGRRVWAVLVVVPLAIPDFVVSFGWASLSTWVSGFRGAVLVMTLAVYPLVYLPVAASLRNADPAQEEVARSLGAGRAAHLLADHARPGPGGDPRRLPARGAGLLAEYGAFEILGYQTFTTEIFTEFSVSFNIPAASALSLVLVALGMLVLAGESAGRVPRPGQPGGPRRAAGHRAHRLGWWAIPALAAMAALAALALGMPVGSAIYWWVSSTSAPFTGVSILDAALAHRGLQRERGGRGHARGAAGRHPRGAPRRAAAQAARAQHLPGDGDARPGDRAGAGLLQRELRGRPVVSDRADARRRVRGHVLPARAGRACASVAQAPVGLEEVARSLGQSRIKAVLRVTIPLVGPGLAAAFCLVFLSAVTELTATLILVPTGVQTLATQFWNYQQNLAYGQAAPFALAMIAIAAVPSYVLGRFFDRLPARRAQS